METLTCGAPTAIAKPAAAFTNWEFANVVWFQVEVPARRVDTVKGDLAALGAPDIRKGEWARSS